jgi:hypothetical protein
MARRTGYSRSYLGNAETGARQVTPGLIRAYERVLGDNVNRRELLVGAVSAFVAASAASVPDIAADIAADAAVERNKLLVTVQTSHEVDKIIAGLISKDTPSLASLAKWARRGSPVLRVNAAGILAKVGSPALDDEVVQVLKADQEARDLYLTAVVARVLGMPWDDAGRLATSAQPLAEDGYLQAFAEELTNRADSGARWCSVVMLSRTRAEAPQEVTGALTRALQIESSRENLRALGCALAGLDPLAV